jgi:acyl carrier protein
VGYVVKQGGEELEEREMKRKLREKLPEYMVPGRIVMLREMPLSPNGKIDRRALPDPEKTRYELRPGGPNLSTPIEEIITGIWCDVLGQNEIGIDESFFDLGGHSLLATQVMSRVREVFRAEIPLRSIFDTDTIAGFTRKIKEHVGAATSGIPPRIERGPDSERVALSFAQQRLWFIQRLAPENTAYNMSNEVRLSGQVNVKALDATLVEITRRHEVLRTSFISEDGEPLQVIGGAEQVRLMVVDLRELDLSRKETETRRLAREEGETRFDLERGPLLRVRLLRLEDEESLLLVTMHHIASDGWSLDILIRETGLLYEAYSGGRGSPLEELQIQYKDFARWQREWMKGEVLEKQLDYWKRQLKGIEETGGLPTDYPRSAEGTSRGARLKRVISKEVRERLKEMGRQQGVTLFMTLLGAFEVVMKHYSGRDEVVVGTDVANRNRGETEGLIGFFVNQLVMRMEVKGEWSFEELLRRVREVALEGYANQDVPFEKVVEAMNPRRAGGQSPFFQVKLILQNAPQHSLDVKGLRVKVVEVQNRTAKSDILLSLFENDDGLLCNYQYDTSLFERDTITRLADQYEIVLREVISVPASPLCQVIERLNERDKQDAIDKRTRSKNAQRQKLKGLALKSAAGSQLNERESV